MNQLTSAMAPRSQLPSGTALDPAHPQIPEALSRSAVSVALRRFGFAILATCVATLLRYAMGRQWLGDISLLMPLLAVAASATYGGWAAGVVTTALLCCADTALSNRGLAPAVSNTDLPLLLSAGVLISLVGGEVFAARQRAHASDLERLDLERKVLEISDEERCRIGHDLHDGLGQHLTGISLLSASLAQRIECGSTHTAADAEKISQLVAQTIGWTRELARGLSPVILESDGLLGALEELAQNAQSLLGIQCSWRCEGPPPQLDRQAAMHIFRIVQEAVSNSVKHGKARTVHIKLLALEDALTVRVIDDGCGLSAKTKANPGLGLRIMNYRARMVAARLTVDRAGPTGGTVVTCQCHLPSEQHS